MASHPAMWLVQQLSEIDCRTVTNNGCFPTCMAIHTYSSHSLSYSIASRQLLRVSAGHNWWRDKADKLRSSTGPQP